MFFHIFFRSIPHNYGYSLSAGVARPFLTCHVAMSEVVREQPSAPSEVVRGTVFAEWTEHLQKLRNLLVDVEGAGRELGVLEEFVVNTFSVFNTRRVKTWSRLYFLILRYIQSCMEYIGLRNPFVAIVTNPDSSSVRCIRLASLPVLPDLDVVDMPELGPLSVALLASKMGGAKLHGNVYLNYVPSALDVVNAMQSKCLKIFYDNSDKSVSGSFAHLSGMKLRLAVQDTPDGFLHPFSFDSVWERWSGDVIDACGIFQKDRSPESFAMGLAKISELRAQDGKTRVGACLVAYDSDREWRIVSIGYNGKPLGSNLGVSFIKDEKNVLMSHAEAGCLLFSGESVDHPKSDGMKYVLATTLWPCGPRCGLQILDYFQSRKPIEWRVVVYRDDPGKYDQTVMERVVKKRAGYERRKFCLLKDLRPGYFLDQRFECTACD